MKDLRRWHIFFTSLVEKHDKQNKEKPVEAKIQTAEDLFSFIVKDKISTLDGYLRIRKLILKHSSVEKRFLIGGIG